MTSEEPHETVAMPADTASTLVLRRVFDAPPDIVFASGATRPT